MGRQQACSLQRGHPAQVSSPSRFTTAPPPPLPPNVQPGSGGGRRQRALHGRGGHAPGGRPLVQLERAVLARRPHCQRGAARARQPPVQRRAAAGALGGWAGGWVAVASRERMSCKRMPAHAAPLTLPTLLPRPGRRCARAAFAPRCCTTCWVAASGSRWSWMRLWAWGQVRGGARVGGG